MHHDLKPENVLFLDDSDESDIKLADFGLALEFSPGKKFSRMAEKAYYMAPEVLHGEYLEELDLTSEPWQTISPSAKDMIAQMLCLDEKLTCTTAQALGGDAIVGRDIATFHACDHNAMSSNTAVINWAFHDVLLLIFD
ncbi:hypothetical protein L7F22_037671 [Adiantum nelumboides]|nr:hypothetical protein [Adiantum nelumboides]